MIIRLLWHSDSRHAKKVSTLAPTKFPATMSFRMPKKQNAVDTNVLNCIVQSKKNTKFIRNYIFKYINVYKTSSCQNKDKTLLNFFVLVCFLIGKGCRAVVDKIWVSNCLLAAFDCEVFEKVINSENFFTLHCGKNCFHSLVARTIPRLLMYDTVHVLKNAVF